MDPWTESTDPPAAKEPPEAAELPTHIAHVANPTPSLGPNHHHSHPPYAEMITAAIAALKEKNGSSRQAIAKYIEETYTNLPATHSTLLTHQLKRLKNNGQILMVKHSYLIPRSVPLPSATTGSATVPVVGNDGNNASGPKKRGRGRPPKSKGAQKRKPRLNHAVVGPEPVPVFFGVDDEPLPTPVGTKRGRGRLPRAKSGLLGPETGGGPVEAKRGRGRPPKPKLLSVLMGQTGLPKRRPGRPPGLPKRRPGRPPKTVHIGSVPAKDGSVIKPPGRPRGRPAKNYVSAVSSPASGGTSVVSGVGMLSGKRRGQPAKKNAVAADDTKGGGLVAAGSGVLLGKKRGRPVKNTLYSGATGSGGDGRPLVGSGGAATPGRRRGRLANSSGVKKLRKLSGKPLGRPKKNALFAGSQAVDSQLLVAREDFKIKLHYFQSRIKQAVGIVKPYLSDTAVSALGALQELEELATTDLSVSSNVPAQVQVQESLL